MKIFQVISSLASGGAEKFVVYLSNELANLGHDVTVCVIFSHKESHLFNKQFLNSNVKFKSFDRKNKTLFGTIDVIYNFCKTESPDIIHLHLVTLKYFIPIYFSSKIKVFHTVHNLAQYASGDKYWDKLLFRYLYKHGYVKPICISKECEESFFDFYHFKCYSTIVNGGFAVEISSSYSNVYNEIISYKHSPNSLLFIHVARFSAQKNQDLLVDTFNQLAKEGLDYELLIIGEGFDSDKAQALRLKVNERIHFLGVKSNVGDYLACVDAYCLSSNYEGLPISLLEAMSIGVTPICTAVGGISTVIEDNYNGYLASEISIDGYKDAIMRFVKGGGFKNRLIEQFQNEYSINKCAKSYIELYAK